MSDNLPEYTPDGYRYAMLRIAPTCGRFFGAYKRPVGTIAVGAGILLLDPATKGPPRAFAVHASAPSQEYSALKSMKTRKYPDLLKTTRDMLIRSGVPWILENVYTAPMHQGVMICGTAMGLNVRRHRLFDSSHLLYPPRTMQP